MILTTTPLASADIPQADRIFRIAFGTRNGLADPMLFDGDAARIQTRLDSPNVMAVGAREGGDLIAIAMATVWGSYGWLGPLAVLPDYWNYGVAQNLLGPVIERLEKHGTTHLALFTVAESTKHVALYRKFGFWPGFLTLLMTKDLTLKSSDSGVLTWSLLSERDRRSCVASCARITNALYPGLDLSTEMASVSERRLGEVVFLGERQEMVGFAICHFGPGTEAETGTAYIKFAAVRPGPEAEIHFTRLISECGGVATRRGMKKMLAGVNTSRRGAYAALVKGGFRSVQQGVAMHRPDDFAYDRPDAFVVDDLR